MTAPGTVLDTSAWVALLNGEGHSNQIPKAMEGRTALVTPIVLAELAALAERDAVAKAAVRDVEAMAAYVALERDDAVAAGRLVSRLRREGNRSVGLGDCLIYATARRVGATLVTSDADLAGRPGVRRIQDPPA